MDVQHNYVKVILAMVEAGKISQDIPLSQLEVYHDDHCGVFEGRFCDCEPEVEYNPVALVRLVRSDDCYLWVTDKCPLCGGSHTHGGGHLDGDPRALLGHRRAHCDEPKPPGYYTLIEE